VKTRTAMFIVTLGLSALPVSAGRLAVITTALPGRTALPLNLGAMEGGPRGIVGYQPGDLLSPAAPQIPLVTLSSLLAVPAAGSTAAASLSGAGVQIGMPVSAMTVSAGSSLLQGVAGLASTGSRRSWSVSAANLGLSASGLIPHAGGQGQVTTVVPVPPSLWTGLAILSTSMMLSASKSVRLLAQGRKS
jgi:hypothetical protein